MLYTWFSGVVSVRVHWISGVDVQIVPIGAKYFAHIVASFPYRNVLYEVIKIVDASLFMSMQPCLDCIWTPVVAGYGAERISGIAPKNEER